LIERPLEEIELPAEPPTHRYPTALREPSDEGLLRGSPPAATAKSEASASLSPAAAQSPTQPAANEHVEKSPSPQRIDHSQPLLTPLAVIPPQYVHAAARPPAAAAESAATAASTTGVPLAMTAAIGAELTAPLGQPFITGLTAVPAAVEPHAAGIVPAANTSQQAPTVVSPAVHESAREETNQEPATAAVRREQAQKAWIESLEEDIRRRRGENATDDELPRLEQQLRLAYLAAGRFDDAVAAVASLDTPQSEAYKHLMFGLGVWLSPDEARRQSLRSAKVLHSLREATSELAAASKLEVRKIAFCERVDYYGWYTEFPRNEFHARQEVILYAEIENFSADQKGPAAFETELQGSYEILDSAGQTVASRQLQLDKETCRNLRRDYYLAYKMYMPENVTPGRYRLELTVEDLKARGKYQGRKLGEGVVEFTIK
jgi:hypothetical protein